MQDTQAVPPQVGVRRRWGLIREDRLQELRRSLYRFRRNRLSLVGLGLAAFLAAVAVVGPYFVPYPEDGRATIHADRRLLAPSGDHWFGTDEVGRDVFSRVVLGAQVSLKAAVIVILLAAVIGIPLGAIAGFWGGWMDELIMRVTDIFLVIPGLILALAIAAALGPSLTNAMIAIALVWWPSYARLVRGQVLALREESYVQAARGVGSGRLRVIFVHILPNTLSPLTVKFSLDMGFAILTTAGLGFLGVGAQPPTPEWGMMVSQGRRFLPTWWWYATFPGLAIFFTVLAFNLIGDGLRDVLDPRARR
jgi:peptide/nickel transport system permease protein